jgi:CRP/FNR family transcriptional regulator, cyclic AMP receptor protein
MAVLCQLQRRAAELTATAIAIVANAAKNRRGTDAHHRPRCSSALSSTVRLVRERPERMHLEYRVALGLASLIGIVVLATHANAQRVPQTVEPIIGKISQETLAAIVGTTRSKLGLIDYHGQIVVHNSLLNVVLNDNPHLKTRDGALRPFVGPNRQHR